MTLDLQDTQRFDDIATRTILVDKWNSAEDPAIGHAGFEAARRAILTLKRQGQRAAGARAWGKMTQADYDTKREADRAAAIAKVNKAMGL